MIIYTKPYLLSGLSIYLFIELIGILLQLPGPCTTLVTSAVSLVLSISSEKGELD